MSELKTRFKYIHFERILNPGKKTQKWMCRNNRSGAELGRIRWESSWRQYVFETVVEPEDDYGWWVYFSRGCLRDIADFIDQLMEERKK